MKKHNIVAFVFLLRRRRKKINSTSPLQYTALRFTIIIGRAELFSYYMCVYELLRPFFHLSAFKHKAHISRLVGHIVCISLNSSWKYKPQFEQHNLRLLYCCTDANNNSNAEYCLQALLPHAHAMSRCLLVTSALAWCHLFWLVVPQSLSSGEAILDPSFSFKPCFRHAKLTATLWVNAACECWDARGVSEWKAPIPATCMVLHNWLRFVFFKGPLFLPLCLLLLV